MPYSIQDLIKAIDPTKTVLFFGAGSSIPSGAPSAINLAQAIRLKFGVENETLGLADVASLAEKKASRKDLVEFVRFKFRGLHVTGGMSMFVCLKNIFATEKFDDIIVREFNGVEEKYREIYRVVAAMEHAGIRVHRQLVIRLLQVPANEIKSILQHLEELVIEYDVAPRDAIYGWRVRHPVIAGIISKYKFSKADELSKLFERVIDSISPVYPIEVRTLVEICNVETGIPSIGDKREQNRLLRKMISMAPGERVPRHRLIRNLIDLGEFDEAETEVKLFRKDLGKDGPLARYEIDLLTARAKETPGLLEEDRLTILRQAIDLAQASIGRYNANRTVHIAHCEVALAWFELTDDFSAFADAVEKFKQAEAKFVDPEMTAAIRRIERKASTVQSNQERQKTKQPVS